MTGVGIHLKHLFPKTRLDAWAKIKDPPARRKELIAVGQATDGIVGVF